MSDTITAYVNGEVTKVSKMIDVHSKFPEKSPGYRGSRLSAPGTRSNRGDPFTAYVSGEVTQVSKMTNVHSKFLEKSSR